MPIDELADEVLVTGLDEPADVPGEVLEHTLPDLPGEPSLHLRNDVRDAGRRLAVAVSQILDGLHDGLEDLDLAGALVLRLVLVPPMGDVLLEGRVEVLWEDPPLVPVVNDVLEVGVTCCEALEVTVGRRSTTPKDPEGQVEVRARDGPVEDLVIVDRREVLVARGEGLVVFEELGLALGRAVLDEDPSRRPRAIEALVKETLEDVRMYMMYIRRCSIPVVDAHEDLVRVDLLVLLEKGLLLECLDDTMSNSG